MASKVLLGVLEDLYAKHVGPVPGALVKARVLSEATQAGNTFSERELGYKNFLEFVKAVPRNSRPNSYWQRHASRTLDCQRDSFSICSSASSPSARLLARIHRIPCPQHTAALRSSRRQDLPRGRPHPAKRILIDPVSRDTQLAWRRSFSEGQSDNIKGDLLASLNGTELAIFNAFSRRLRENPLVLRAWNRYLQQQITDHVAAWAKEKGVLDDRWRADPPRLADGTGTEAALNKPQSISQRGELYNFSTSCHLKIFFN